MVYDFDKFVAADLMGIIQKYRVTSFCAPPTIYRFLIKEGMDGYDLSSLDIRHQRGGGPQPRGVPPVSTRTPAST